MADGIHRCLLVVAATICTAVDAVTRTPAFGVICAPSTPRTASSRCAIDSEWRDKEDWALADSVPQFTVGSGESVATFWQALAAATPELAGRTASECESRWGELEPQQRIGPQPPVLEDWEKLPDGRYSGRVNGGSSVWLTVALEGKLSQDPRLDEPGYIEAVGGKIFELSRASAVRRSEAATGAAPPAALTAPTKEVALAAAAVLFAGGAGFGLGTSVAPPPALPPPPPQVTKVFIAPGASTRRTPMDAPSADPRAAIPLTVGEQRERAELRVDRDKTKLQMLQQRLKEDEQRVAEYRRVEAERGAAAEAVKLIFPPP